MKLNSIPKSKRTAGMTLLELTVVILVLLSLITILFVGARAWKKGSDRSANIMNLRNVQQAVRGHQNMRGLNEGDPVTEATIFGAAGDGVGGYLKAPNPPTTSISYSYLGEVPAIGTLYTTATYGEGASAEDYGPAEGTTNDW